MIKDGKIKASFLTELNKDADTFKKFPADVEVKVLPAQNNPVDNQILADRYGIRVKDKSKTKLYFSQTNANQIKKATVKDFKE